MCVSANCTAIIAETTCQIDSINWRSALFCCIFCFLRPLTDAEPIWPFNLSLTFAGLFGTTLAMSISLSCLCYIEVVSWLVLTGFKYLKKIATWYVTLKALQCFNWGGLSTGLGFRLYNLPFWPNLCACMKKLLESSEHLWLIRLPVVCYCIFMAWLEISMRFFFVFSNDDTSTNDNCCCMWLWWWTS